MNLLSKIKYKLQKNFKGGIYTNIYISATEDDFSSDDVCYERNARRIFCHCEHCGSAIYSPKDALIVDGSGDVIHLECWREYAEEHMFDFTQKATEAVG